MIEILYDLVQGSEEWNELRKTHISATDAYDLLNGVSIPDILQHKQENHSFTSSATERGHVLEHEAAKLYSDFYGIDLEQAGAILNSKYPNAMCSPDRLLPDGLLEIKGFELKHHEELLTESDPYVEAQVQFQLLISERAFVDLVQYCPEEPDLDKAFHVRRIYPDPEIQEKLKTLLTQTINQDLTQDVSEIINLEQQIQAFETRLGDELTQYQNQKQQLEILKQNLKDSTTGKISKTLELDGDKLSLSIYDTHRVVCTDPQNVPKDYLMEEEITEPCFARDDKIYRYIPNTKLAQNLLKAGKSLPTGFTDKPSRNIRIKFNGKAI